MVSKTTMLSGDKIASGAIDDTAAVILAATNRHFHDDAVFALTMSQDAADGEIATIIFELGDIDTTARRLTLEDAADYYTVDKTAAGLRLLRTTATGASQYQLFRIG